MVAVGRVAQGILARAFPREKFGFVNHPSAFYTHESVEASGVVDSICAWTKPAFKVSPSSSLVQCATRLLQGPQEEDDDEGSTRFVLC
mmetsp:Transcript_42906/g.108324  ORF Transcript_42906/g.108324 Transcript_42906/m.108324 type:complete len:88 (+) Transcript_42906:1479-1742(+)